MEELEDESLVGCVTTFYSPSLFWFLYNNDIPARNAYNEKLNAPSVSYTDVRNVSIEQKVIVQHGDQWARAKVADIKEGGIQTKEYVCWLLDYGVFIVTNRVYKLPKSCKSVSPFAKKAMLYGLHSVVMNFDFGAHTLHEHREVEWVPGIRRFADDILKTPNITQIFRKKFKFDDYLIGDVYIKKQEKLFHMGDKIVASGLAKYDEAAFMASLQVAKQVEKPMATVYVQTRFYSEVETARLLQAQERTLGRGTFRSLQTCVKDRYKKSIQFSASNFCDAENDASLLPAKQNTKVKEQTNEEQNKKLVSGRGKKLTDMLSSRHSENILGNESENKSSCVPKSSEKERGINKKDYNKFEDAENKNDLPHHSKQKSPAKNEEQISGVIISPGNPGISHCIVDANINSELSNKSHYNNFFQSIRDGIARLTSLGTETNNDENNKIGELKSADQGLVQKSTETNSESESDQVKSVRGFETKLASSDEFKSASRASTKSAKTDNNEFESTGRGAGKTFANNDFETGAYEINSTGRGFRKFLQKTNYNDESKSVGLGCIKELVKTDSEHEIEEIKSAGRGLKKILVKTNFESDNNDDIKFVGQGCIKKSVKINLEPELDEIKSAGRGLKKFSEKTYFETDNNDDFKSVGQGCIKKSVKINLEPELDEIKSAGRGLKKFSGKTNFESDNYDDFESVGQGCIKKSVKIDSELETDEIKSAGRGFRKKSVSTDSETDTTDEFISVGRGLGKSIAETDFEIDLRCVGRGISKKLTITDSETDSTDEMKPVGRGLGRKSINTDSDNHILSSDEFKSYGRRYGENKYLAESSEDTFDDADETKTGKSSVFRSSVVDVLDKDFTPAGANFRPNFQIPVHPKRPPQETNETACAENRRYENVKHNNQKIAGLCQCNICQGWRNNDKVFEPIDDKPKPKQEKIVIKPPLLFKTKNEEIEYYYIRTKREFDNEMEKLASPRILVHGHFSTKLVSDLPHVPFEVKIQKALRELNYNTAYSIQSYSWCSVLRGENVIIISGPDSGKTMVYVPAICNFYLSPYPDLPQGLGPFSIILCPRIKIVDQVYRLFTRVLRKCTDANIYGIVQLSEKVVVHRLVKGVDILITTPRLLIKMLKTELFNLNRLSHVVLDEAHELYSSFPTEVNYILKKCQKVLMNRTVFVPIQLIAVSQEWTKPIEELAKSFKIPPLICIGAHLEAALYGKADIKIQLSDSKEKDAKLIEIIKDTYKYRKTVIICNDSDTAKELLKNLDTYDIAYETLLFQSVMEDITAIKTRWLNSLMENYFVLVCSDNIFNTGLAISDADVIIQYSLPESWSQFTFRFSGFIDKYTSPMSKIKETNRCLMHIIVDETNIKQFPKVLQLLQRMGTKLTQSLLNFYSELTSQMEIERLKAETPLCEELISFGSCRNNISCKFRHMLCPKTDVSTFLPHSGIIKFKVLHTESPSHYYARLLQHTDADGVSHDISDYYSLIATQLLTLKNESVLLPVSKLRIGTLCAVQETGGVTKGTFQRCKILEIIRNANTFIKCVLVRFIDLGWEQKVLRNNLFILPQHLHNIPAQAIPIFISNIGPPDNDLTWPVRSTVFLNKEFRSAGYSQVNCFFTSRIKLQIGGALLVDDLKLREVLDDGTLVIHKMSVCETLIGMKTFEKRPDHLEKLYKHCKMYNFPLKDYSLPVVHAIKKLDPQVKPTWAHLENDEEYNVVYFSMAHNPGSFFIKLSKNADCLEQLYKNINAAMSKPFYRSVVSAMEGRCYLVKDPEEEKYARVIVKKLKVTTAECLFVDYGDCVEVSINELKFLPDELITQLPFQAIECKLYGIEPAGENKQWFSESTDIFYDIAYEPASDIFRYLHVKVMEKEKAEYTGYKKYSVILIDTYDEDKIINNLLLDLGYAVPTVDEPIEVDFEKCRFKSFNDENAGDSEEELHEIVKYKSGETIAEDEALAHEADKWDFHCNDINEFCRNFFPQQYANLTNSIATESDKIIELNSQESSNLKELPMPNPGYSTPNIIWQQTDTHLTLRIQIAAVEEYEIKIIRNRMFSFQTTYRETTYKVNLHLFEKVDSHMDHCSLGLYVLVKIKKLSPEEWPRLVLTKDKQRYITYNVAVIPIDEESDDDIPLHKEKIKSSKKLGKELKEEDQNGPYIYEIGSDIDWDESDVESEHDSDAS